MPAALLEALRQAADLLAQRKMQAAEALLARALETWPNQPALLGLLGAACMQAGKLKEALANLDKALAASPDDAGMLNSRGNVLADLNRPEEALASFDRALAIKPGFAEALTNRGVTLHHLQRWEEAYASFDRALALKPDLVPALINQAVTLQGLQRFEEALANCNRALGFRPAYAEAWNNRGIALQHLNRFDEALVSYDKALALAPNYAEAWNNRGIVLQHSKRFRDALASFDRALALKPDYAEAWNHRGVALQRLNNFASARASFDKALAIHPDYAGALQNLGLLLCESNQVEEGLAVLARHATLVHRTKPHAVHEPGPPHKAKHDREQRDYLAGGKAWDDDPLIVSTFHLAGGARLANPAVNPAGGDIEARWQKARPQIAVIDDFLTDEALKGLREFCHGSTVWRRDYEFGGYLGATPEDGFACPLLAQIADELRVAFPAIFGSHPLCYLWAFKYDSRLKGTNVHADGAAVNVNFWITPDDANLDPESGGLIVWDVAAPLDWDFDKYNGDPAASRDFLARAGARPVTIPYRANRAVIFDSDLFHETDKIVFKDGYLNRRINVTLLYGRRPPHEG